MRLKFANRTQGNKQKYDLHTNLNDVLAIEWSCKCVCNHAQMVVNAHDTHNYSYFDYRQKPEYFSLSPMPAGKKKKKGGSVVQTVSTNDWNQG